MSFTSTFFLFLFFPIVLAGYYIVRNELRNLFLLAASLLFFAAGDTEALPILLSSIVVNYILALVLEKTRRWNWAKFLILLVMLGWNFGLLFYYKYFVFTLESINSLFNLNVVIPVIMLPLGISFFTFRTVSYCLDVYWETTPVQKNFFDFALYVSFFPQVTMGPITKYSAFKDQLHNRTFCADTFHDGIKLIITGTFKKLVFANSIAVMVDRIFSSADAERTVLMAWLGIFGYLLQLYYDFDGYSDVAIGLGKLFGFTTPSNFNYPYASKTIADFWARWHSTLGVWLKDYLYTPVFRTAMRKRISTHTCNILALLAVWLFAGIWHGAGLKFLIYGLYYFAFIAMERTVEYYEKKRRKRLKLKKKPETKVHAAISHIYFFVVIIFGQLLFRADSLNHYGHYLGSMFGLTGNAVIDPFSKVLLADNWMLMLLGAIFCFPIVPCLKKQLVKYPKAYIICETLSVMVYFIMLLIGVSYMMTSSYNPFLYLNF